MRYLVAATLCVAVLLGGYALGRSSMPAKPAAAKKAHTYECFKSGGGMQRQHSPCSMLGD